MNNKIYIKWEEFHHDVKALCQKIRTAGEFNKIVAISRGGLIPAGIISYELNIRNCHTINISTYIDNEHKKLDRLENLEDVGDIDERTLIIDDLCDSGQTFRLLRDQFPRGRFVTVYSKIQGIEQADLYTRELPDQWIVFPWDVE